MLQPNDRISSSIRSSPGSFLKPSALQLGDKGRIEGYAMSAAIILPSTRTYKVYFKCSSISMMAA